MGKYLFPAIYVKRTGTVIYVELKNCLKKINNPIKNEVCN